MATPPSEIKVGPYRMTVQWDEAAINREGAQVRENLAGQTRLSKQRILIDPTMAPDYKAETLLHEVLHAIWDTVHLPDEAKHEQAVGGLAPTLLAVLRENPALVAYLLEPRESAQPPSVLHLSNITLTTNGAPVPNGSVA